MSDVIVIGGGIAGLSAAARLAPDASVTVLERESATGYHASGRSAAVFEPNYGAPSVRALNRASEAYLRQGGYLSPRGLMLLGKAEEQSAFEADVASMGLVPISVAEAREIIPVLDPAKLRYAAYHEGAQDIDTHRLLEDFARTVRAHGGQVLTGHPVTVIGFAGGKWQVTAKDRVFHADLLINAAGAWADEVAAMAGLAPLGIVPHRRSMARIPAPAEQDVSRWPVFFGVGESWYAKPDAGFLLVSPADEDPVAPHDAWAEDLTLAQGLARYEEMVCVPVTRLQSSWAGLRSFAPDRSLVLGPDPAQPAFVWSAGQGGYGFQTSPAASRLVADLVMGRPCEIDSEVVALLTPARLR